MTIVCKILVYSSNRILFLKKLHLLNIYLAHFAQHTQNLHLVILRVIRHQLGFFFFFSTWFLFRKTPTFLRIFMLITGGHNFYWRIKVAILGKWHLNWINQSMGKVVPARRYSGEWRGFKVRKNQNFVK